MSNTAFAFSHDTTNNAFYGLAEGMGNYYIGGSGSYNDITTKAESGISSSTFYACRLYEKQD